MVRAQSAPSGRALSTKPKPLHATVPDLANTEGVRMVTKVVYQRHRPKSRGQHVAAARHVTTYLVKKLTARRFSRSRQDARPRAQHDYEFMQIGHEACPPRARLWPDAQGDGARAGRPCWL
jgi:hypothetical protein